MTHPRLEPTERKTKKLSDPAHEALQAVFSDNPDQYVVEDEMAGGASTRRFFRIRRQGVSVVAMYLPPADQGVAQARQSQGAGPFVEIAALLRERGVKVPQIFENFDSKNILLVEDLGEDTLDHFLGKRPECKKELYQLAVRDLARAHRSLDELPSASIVRQRAFDAELLRWEINHFHDWALEARGIVLSGEEHDVFHESAAYLAKTIASWDRSFVHRDYQSRNLMVRRGHDGFSLTWIDFQDAMMGPRAYDLVALLTDSYQEFSREFVQERLDEYCIERGTEVSRETLGFEFEFLSVQRKLKDAGRFIFMDRHNHNPSFSPYVDSTIQKARGALARVKHQGPLHRLAHLLDKYCP